VALAWSRAAPPPPATARAVRDLCAAHPGAAPVLVEWGEAEDPTNPGRKPGVPADPGLAPGVGSPPLHARLRSRSLRVEVDDELLAALRGLLGPDHVHLVRATAPPVPTESRPRSNGSGTSGWHGAT